MLFSVVEWLKIYVPPTSRSQELSAGLYELPRNLSILLEIPESFEDLGALERALVHLKSNFINIRVTPSFSSHVFISATFQAHKHYARTPTFFYPRAD